MTVLEEPQYTLLFRVSWITLFSTCYCYYNSHKWIAILPGSIWATSILYWYYPDYSWRRYLDIGVVNVCLFVQHVVAYNAEHSIPYYVLSITATGCFVLGLFLHKAGNSWGSTYAHIGLHVLTNLACLILYSGKIM